MSEADNLRTIERQLKDFEKWCDKEGSKRSYDVMLAYDRCSFKIERIREYVQNLIQVSVGETNNG